MAKRCSAFVSVNSCQMADNDVDVNEELWDYEDDPETETPAGETGDAAPKDGKVKGNYVSIHSSGFRDFLLKPEVLRAIVDCGFEHPSEVQHECIPQVNIDQCCPTMMSCAGVWKLGDRVPQLLACCSLTARGGLRELARRKFCFTDFN